MWSTAVPGTFVTVLLIWTWSVVAGDLTIFLAEKSGIVGGIFIIISTFLVILTITCYWRVILIGPGSPLDFPELIPNDIDSLIPPPISLQWVTIKSDGNARFCNKCKVWKPDRCHHCSGCDKCILRMDHHCPWFGTCIGYKNHRFFFQFLIYSTIYSILVGILSSWYVWKQLENGMISINVMFVAILGFVFGLSLLGFTGFTIYNLLTNRTTIEQYEKQRYRHRRFDNPFDLGWKNNWHSVMKFGLLTWLPIGLQNDINGGILFDNDRGQDLIARLSGEFSRV